MGLSLVSFHGEKENIDILLIVGAFEARKALDLFGLLWHFFFAIFTIFHDLFF
jgi:hypothetical protein